MTGIVRSPRRPAGWVPPGPPPAGARGRAELEPQPDEDLCLLSGDWRIFQKQRGHRWSLDDLVTAWVAAEAVGPVASIEPAGRPLRALDLGCGLGSVLMMTAWRFPSAQVRGVEAQAERAAMARRSLAYNGAEDRCRVFDGDLRQLGELEQDEPELAGPFELITGTPPYFPRGAGTESTTPQVAPCRFELRGGVEEYLAAAAPRLAETGRLVVCTAALERERVVAAAEATSLDLLAHWDIVPREGKAVLVMVDVLARRGEASPPQPAMHTLLVRDRANVWTADFRAVRAAMGMPATTPAGA